MTPEPQIAPMGGRHIDAVLAIDALAYSAPWSAGTWRKELAANDRLHLVAIAGSEVVGHAGLLFVLDEVHVTTVAVHPEQRGQGIASRLLVELLAAAVAHGSAAATLEVRAKHVDTQRLYSRFGFRPVGIRRGYYSSPTDDAIVMWLTDLRGDETASRLRRLESGQAREES